MMLVSVYFQVYKDNVFGLRRILSMFFFTCCQMITKYFCYFPIYKFLIICIMQWLLKWFCGLFQEGGGGQHIHTHSSSLNIEQNGDHSKCKNTNLIISNYINISNISILMSSLINFRDNFISILHPFVWLLVTKVISCCHKYVCNTYTLWRDMVLKTDIVLVKPNDIM